MKRKREPDDKPKTMQKNLCELCIYINLKISLHICVTNHKLIEQAPYLFPPKLYSKFVYYFHIKNTVLDKYPFCKTLIDITHYCIYLNSSK